MQITVTSTAFKEGDKLPVDYTCDGRDISPPLAFSEPPAGTQSLSLIVDDPDAPGGIFTHWLIFNLPAATRRLTEAVPESRLANGAVQGKSDFGNNGYSGPCPPHGTLHHYRFTVYALNKKLDLKTGVSRRQFDAALQDCILAEGRLTAVYQL